MPAKLFFAPEAERDLAEAFAWYEEQRPGLGEELLRCIEACIEAIRRTPGIHSVVHESYRRGLVRRFPYAVFYEYRNERIIVIAVFHTARDPNKWRGRLP
jgi:plasmid stabilization system protein ParE